MTKRHITRSIKGKYRRIRAKLLSIGLSDSTDSHQPREEIMASSDISVVIAIHDAPGFARRCLESVERYGADAEIILVDDGSQLLRTSELIRDYQQKHRWTVIRHDEPVGHSRSCEQGSRAANRPYLCFLNSDTVITPWSWRAAQEAFEADPRIAVTGPSTSWAATRQCIRRAEHCRHYWTNLQICAFAEKYVHNRLPKAWVDVPYVAGFAFFIRHELWDALGGFTQSLLDYGNEAELCARLHRRRFCTVWTQGSYIHHFGQKSYGQILARDEMIERRLRSQSYVASAIRAYVDSLHPGDSIDGRHRRRKKLGIWTWKA